MSDSVSYDIGKELSSVVQALTPEQYAKVASNLMIAKMYSLAACVMLFYDMIITFGDEVDRVWSRRFSLVNLLWFLNRYLSPLGYIVIIVSFHDPWSKEVCNRYILFPEALKIVTTAVIGTIFIIRLWAMYGKSTAIVAIGSVLLTAELLLKIWAFTDGTSITLPPGLVGCILVGKHHARFAITWIAELGFDTIIFILTLYKTFSDYDWRKKKNSSSPSLISVILRDGVVYFAVIFGANLLTVLIFMLAPPDIKAINASFSTLITSLMASRIILNLRRAGSLLNEDSNMPTRQETTHQPSAEFVGYTTEQLQLVSMDTSQNRIQESRR